jgi:hypothetical protein
MEILRHNFLPLFSKSLASCSMFGEWNIMYLYLGLMYLYFKVVFREALNIVYTIRIINTMGKF